MGEHGTPSQCVFVENGIKKRDQAIPEANSVLQEFTAGIAPSIWLTCKNIGLITVRTEEREKCSNLEKVLFNKDQYLKPPN